MFGKRFHLIEVNGISIGFDISWFFVAILLTWTLSAGYFPVYYPGLDRAAYLLMGLAGMFGLFGSVILHELGHALTAQRFDLPISRITLFIFGGIAELKKEPPNPKAEFLVAVAGPIVSIVLSGFFGMSASLGERGGWPAPFVAVMSYLSAINLIIVIFNLIPAFPLDGGRMFRSFLWWRKGRLGWATRVSSRIGSGFGFILIFLGVLVLISGNFIAGMWWMILGLFLQQAASSSRTQYYIKKALQGEKVKSYMVKELHTVSPNITVQELIDQHVYKTYHHLYPVVNGKELLGYVSLEEVKNLDRTKWKEKNVKDVLIPLNQIDTLAPNTDVMEAFSTFHKTPAESLLVTENHQLAGLLSASDLSKIISLRLELEEEN